MRAPFGWMRGREEGRGEGSEGSRGGGREGPPVLGVAELNRRARLLLERQFPDLWVEGEISDLRRPPSGHLYFRLNDEREQAQIACVLFRGDARRSRAPLVNGGRVRLRGELSLFEPRGSYQLIARLALPAGEGDLRAQLLALQEKLKKEGLLDPERKRPLPRFPRVVGVVTSRAAAALHDVVRVARGRAPVRLVLSHASVQGAEAPASIVRALRRIQRLPEVEVVILTRGGGASEDLSAFNDERVARAIAACRVPVVSGVGHEVDLTIADLVADRRAATPSNAAELVVPEEAALRELLDGRRRRLVRAMEDALDRARLRHQRATAELPDPRRAIELGQLSLRQQRTLLERAAARRVRELRQAFEELSGRLRRQDLRLRLARDRERLRALDRRLRVALSPRLIEGRGQLLGLRRRGQRAFSELLRARRDRLASLASQLSALSPLSVLGRGYAIALHDRSGRALLAAEEARPGDRLTLRLHRGRLRAEVLESLPEAGSGEPEEPGS